VKRTFLHRAVGHWRYHQAAEHLKRWVGNAMIGTGATFVLLMIVATLAAMILVFGAAGRLLVRWAVYYPK
jgi:hypothetical protein